MASPDCVDKLPASHEGETVSAALRTWVAEMRNIESVTFKTAVEGQEFSISRDDVGKKCRGRTRVLEVIVDDETVDHINLGGDEAVVEYKNGAVYRGTMHNGAADGPGVFSDDRGHIYRGHFLAGRPHGWMVLSSPKLEFAEMFYHHGEICYGGSKRVLTKHSPKALLGMQLGNVKWTEEQGGGFFVDTRHPKASFFLYPDLKFAIKGRFEKSGNRRLVIGLPALVVDLQWHPSGAPVPVIESTATDVLVYEYPTSRCIASTSPMLRDHYEAHTCYVAPSALSGDAGEGLFAARDLEAGELGRISSFDGCSGLVALFNGIRTRRLRRELPCDARKDENWSDYAISMSKDMSLDIPQESVATAMYCATTGHKACHSFEPNANFARFFHPRFGFIMSVVANTEISSGAEILVNYRYPLNSSPDWYRAQWRRYLRNKGWSDSDVVKYGGTAHEVGQYFNVVNERIEKAK